MFLHNKYRMKLVLNRYSLRISEIASKNLLPKRYDNNRCNIEIWVSVKPAPLTTASNRLLSACKVTISSSKWIYYLYRYFTLFMPENRVILHSQIIPTRQKLLRLLFFFVHSHWQLHKALFYFSSEATTVITGLDLSSRSVLDFMPIRSNFYRFVLTTHTLRRCP